MAAAAGAAIAPQAIETLSKQLTPEQIERNYEAFQKLEAKTKILWVKLSHEFALTQDEGHRGMLPAAILLFTFYNEFIKPQLVFFLDLQAGFAETLNALSFGKAGIDSSKIRELAAKVEAGPFAPPPSSNPTGSSEIVGIRTPFGDIRWR